MAALMKMKMKMMMIDLTPVLALVSVIALWLPDPAWARVRLKGPAKVHVVLERSMPGGLEQINLVISDEGKSAILTRNSPLEVTLGERAVLGKFEARQADTVTSEWSFLKLSALKLSQNPLSDVESPLGKLGARLSANFSPTSKGGPHGIRFRVNGQSFLDTTPWGKTLVEATERIIRDTSWKPVDAVEVGPLTPQGQAALQAPVRKLATNATPSLAARSLASAPCRDLGPTLKPGKRAYLCDVPPLGKVRLFEIEKAKGSP